MNEQYHILLDKLDVFIRKYYKNQLLRGGILFLSLFLVFFILVNMLEYYGHFNTRTRTIIFFLYTVLNIAVFIGYLAIPIFKLFRIGKTLTKEQAAEIIGNHFPEVRDKLLNTIQLKTLSEQNSTSFELVRASIEQKIEDLKPIHFPSAIDFGKNRKYLKFVFKLLLTLS